jgi:hypothetical protein
MTIHCRSPITLQHITLHKRTHVEFSFHATHATPALKLKVGCPTFCTSNFIADLLHLRVLSVGSMRCHLIYVSILSMLAFETPSYESLVRLVIVSLVNFYRLINSRP